MNADGSQVTQLTNAGENRYPAWSPNSQTIAYTKIIDGITFELRLINADGSGDMLLTTGAYPAWSPDGREIVFTDFVPSGDRILKVIALDTGVIRSLTF